MIKFMFYWASEMISIKLVKREFSMSSSTFILWKKLLQDICDQHLIEHHTPIQDPGKLLELDASELVWRQLIGDPFEGIINCIREIYPQ